MTTIWPVFQRALMITSFVAVMMILVEYLNVLTEGRWRAALRGSRWSQYLVAALLGAVVGVLGVVRYRDGVENADAGDEPDS